jgi:protease-4
MTFLRGVWRVLVGIKDLLALLLLLLIFAALWAASQGGGPALGVPSGSALVMNLDGVVVDQATERSPFEVLSGSSDVVQEIEVRDVVEALDRAATDDRIETVVLDLDRFMGAGQANLQAIGEAIRRVKAAGKPVRAYAAAYLDDGYYLAAQANEAWVDPLGGVLLAGPGGAGLYFKDALAKLGVGVEVFRVGTFKSAVEPFLREDASPEAKAAEQALVDTLWDSYVGDVQTARPAVRLDAMLADLPGKVRANGGDFARTAVAEKLVDRVGTRTQFGAMLQKAVGKGDDADVPGSFNGIGMADYLAASVPSRPTSGGGVGVVYVSGAIVDGEAPPGTAGGDTLAALIAEATANDDIKALVVRVDSPGGSVAASEKIRQALLDAKAEGLPVVASFGPVAASGGYWVATPASEIYAEPTTITGSIGVFAVIPTFVETLKKLGIGADGVKSTPYTGEPDVLDGLSPQTRDLLQLSVEDIYRRFIGVVAQATGLTPAKVDEVGQGRVWAGGTAQQLGLVDRLGGLDDAVRAAAKLGGLDPAKVRTIDVEVTPSVPFQLLEKLMGDGTQEQVPTDAFGKLATLARLDALAQISEAKSVAMGASVQARCLACASYGTPRTGAPPAGLLARILD